ncbi:MAG: hypothetical protein AB2551_01225 [Candidatus Thiodiazotropha sp.]
MSGLDFVEKMVANYNTAFPQYQRFGGPDTPASVTIHAMISYGSGRKKMMLRCNIQGPTGSAISSCPD